MRCLQRSQLAYKLIVAIYNFFGPAKASSQVSVLQNGQYTIGVRSDKLTCDNTTTPSFVR